ncbi:RHS repeat-associated core domain-containing protein, partial [Candidatus Uhrbacteria bacterium]|nr:RHS repeat-associated core domain-containing protein [Candidatus Uhrbacteria bacterium]
VPASATDAERPAHVPVTPTDGVVSSTYGPYVYDPSGNIIVIGSDVPASNVYIYDPMSRLTSATVIHEGNPQTQAYEYDVYGNRTKAGLETYPVTSANRLSSMNALYDTPGNLTRWQPPGSAYVRSYDYDALNMMTREKITINSAEQSFVHIYTADDERYWSMDTFANDGSNVSRWTIRDLDGKVLRVFTNDRGTWQNARDFMYRDGQLLATVSGTTTWHYSLDHLGTPRIVTDGARAEVSRHTYFPFGAELTSATPPADGALRFTGHERDADLNGEVKGALDYMHARFYSSNLGRFASVDAARGRPKDPQTWNRYAYALNSPADMIDPDGNDALAVAFPKFKISFGGRKWGGLGHAGIVVIDKKGRTR